MVLKIGTNAHDVLNGTAFADTLLGLGGNDDLFGFAGNDVLDGGLGLDTMRGGLGNDTYVVSQSTDLVIELAGQGTDVVRSAASFTLGANVENLVLLGAAAINGTGNGLNNAITGNGAANIINGGLGLDTMRGGLGNDTYIVSQSTDLVIELAGQGTDVVRSAASFTLGANVENLVLVGAGAINGTGNVLNNTITGNGAANIVDGGAGNDTLGGNNGNDVLIGGLGNDTLTGGFGADSFRFAPGSGRDIVIDFQDNVDTLFISSAYGFTLQEIINEHSSSSGGDSAIDLSGTGADSPRIILLGFDNSFNLADDIVIF